MPTFRDTFEAYGGDYQLTMDRFLHNEAMYRRLLDMLFEDPTLARLGAALDAGDLKAAFEAAHTLKGVVGNMGLTPLYRAVCAIVEPLRAGDAQADYPALYAAIQAAFQGAQALREALQEVAP